MTYTIHKQTLINPVDFKRRTLWRLHINGVRQHLTFMSISEAKRGAKVLAARWPGKIEIASN